MNVAGGITLSGGILNSKTSVCVIFGGNSWVKSGFARKIVDWFSCVKVFIFVNEQDTDEYKGALKYCIKREFQNEVKAISS